MAAKSDDDVVVEHVEAGSADPAIRDEAEDSDSSSFGESSRRKTKENDSSLRSDSSNQINKKRPATAGSGEEASSTKKLRQEEPSNKKRATKFPDHLCGMATSRKMKKPTKRNASIALLLYVLSQPLA